jgi:predicted transposase YbfD/YdcC
VIREYFQNSYKDKNISIDVKLLRVSDNRQYTQSEHKAILNVFDKDTKIVIAHKFLDKDKKSEIPAFKEILTEDLFSNDSQIFSFDALLTQSDILNEINKQDKKYIAKVKNNQPTLKKDIQERIALFSVANDTFNTKNLSKEKNNLVKRKVEIFQDKSINLAIFSSKFNHIETLIKTTKEIYNPKTQITKTTVEYLIANFKTTAKDFYHQIIQHWGVETYHYHLDMLTKEDAHIAYINPFSISILRSFTINLYQLYLNEHKGEKLNKMKISMAEIKRECLNSNKFISEIFEI